MQTSRYLTSCGARMWSNPTNNVFCCPNIGFLWLSLLQFKQTYTEPGTHCKKDMSAWKTCPCLSPSVPSKTLFLPQFAQSSALWGTTDRTDVNTVKGLKNLHIMAAATLYSGLLMDWRSRWCWQTRMRSQARWCQWCRCRDSCRQGHPHRRPAPPSARTVPAKTASAECFLQQDLEWCPQSKALPSRQGPRARKQAHVRRSEPCCKFCHTESCTGVALKELKPKPKWSRSPTWIQTREQHTDAHVCFELGILMQTSTYLTSCGARMWSNPTNNVFCCPNIGFLWLSLLQFKQTYTEPGTHCKKDMSAWETCPCLSPSVPSKTLFLPQFAQSSALWGTTDRTDVNTVKGLKNLHIMAAATLYSGLLMDWRSRWCWQTRMRSQARWCQWCRCRDSCRQGHPHRRPAPPSARTVPAKTASVECFL